MIAVISLTACENRDITTQPSQLSNAQQMKSLKISDPGIWNKLATQSISVPEPADISETKKAGTYNEYPNIWDYYFAVFEDLYPSEGDYDFNDVILKSKFYIRKMGFRNYEGYIRTSLYHRGGSLPAQIGLMFYTVSGDSYTRIPFEDILVNGENLSDKPWTCSLADLGNEWTVKFAFEYDPANIWVSYFIKINDKEILTAGFAPIETKSFEVPHPAYLSKNNLPWGLEIEAERFAIPYEKELFLNCYPKFQEWAGSNGIENPRWFDYPDSDYTYFK